MPVNKPSFGSLVLASRRAAGILQEKLTSMVECGYMLPCVGIIHRPKKALKASIAEPVDSDV